jgi:hypothetical protein
MISIISSRRHADLLAKERELDDMTPVDKMAAIFDTIPDIDAKRNLIEAMVHLGNAHNKCEPGSSARTEIDGALFHLRPLMAALK